MPAMTPTAGGAQRRRQPGSPAASGAGAKPVASASATRPDAGSPRREEGRTSSPVSSTDRALAEIDALAFATDPASERALREGLAGCRDGQVWPGGLRTAAAALGQGQSPRILFVDLDETPYPAGAIHELAAVCEVGTVVIALGSDDSARSSREILLAGVSDYLVKPVTALAVRKAAVRAAGSAANGSAEGWLVGFAGTGGSGATTLAAATALLAAERGRYVSVLDLNRTFSALSFLLDVEPAGGLVDLLSTVARASLHPDMVDGMRAARSDRIAVYGYSWSVEPPPLAPVWAVCELLVELQRRSHLVIVDGMDDPATRQTLLAMVDARVLVVEPTATGAASAVRMMARLGPDSRSRLAVRARAEPHPGIESPGGRAGPRPRRSRGGARRGRPVRTHAALGDGPGLAARQTAPQPSRAAHQAHGPDPGLRRQPGHDDGRLRSRRSAGSGTGIAGACRPVSFVARILRAT